jgi:hypothetical protein
MILDRLPTPIRRTDAGYRLIATHEVVRGYWFGLFEVADGEAGDR